MKIFKRTTKLLGNAFNTKAVINQHKVLLKTIKKTFTISKATSNCEFNDLYSQGLDELKLQKITSKFCFLYRFFAALALIMVIYAAYLLMSNHLLASVLATSVACVFGAHTFKFHFWSMQIKKRKLGCSLGEWWKYITRGK